MERREDQGVSELASSVDRRTFLKGAAGLGLGVASMGSLATLLSACSSSTSPNTGGTATAAATPAGAGATATAASSGAATQANSIGGSLTVAVYGTADQAKVWDQVFDTFRKQQPSINLSVLPVQSTSGWAGFSDAVITRIAGGQPLDLIAIATEGQRLFISKGAVQSIDDYLARDTAQLGDYFSDIHPKILEWSNTLCSPDGKKYWLPAVGNTMTVWCDKEVFAAAGVPLPANDWTWDDFLATARKLNKPGQVYAFHLPVSYFVGLAPWLLTNGANVVGPDWSKATMNTPEAIESLTFMRQLVSEGLTPDPGGSFDPYAAMAQGKLAMFGGGRWPVLNIRSSNMVDKVRIVDWPKKKSKGSPVGWLSYGILQSSKNKDAAWELVKFMASTEAQKLSAQYSAGDMPLRRSVAQSDAYLGNSPEGMDRTFAAIEYGTAIPGVAKNNLVEADIDNMLTQILAGNVTPADGAAQLNDKIQSNL